MTGKDPGSAGTERGGIPRSVFRATPTPTPIWRTADLGWPEGQRIPCWERWERTRILSPPLRLREGGPRPPKVPNQARWAPHVPRHRPSAPLRLAEHAGRGSSQPRSENRRSAGLDYESQDALRPAAEGGAGVALGNSGAPSASWREGRSMTREGRRWRGPERADVHVRREPPPVPPKKTNPRTAAQRTPEPERGRD